MFFEPSGSNVQGSSKGDIRQGLRRADQVTPIGEYHHSWRDGGPADWGDGSEGHTSRLCPGGEEQTNWRYTLKRETYTVVVHV